MAKVEPRSAVYRGKDVIDYIVRVNVQRRHLTVGQRALLALEALPFYEAEAAKRQKAGVKADLRADLPQGQAARARDQAAKTVGVSGRAVQQAKRVQANAPDLADNVRSGDMTLDSADRYLNRRVAQENESKARRITMDGTVGDAEGEMWKMLHGEFQDRLAGLEDGSVDAIITDPPYSADFLPLWSDMAKVAQRLLKPKGLLIALTGQLYFDSVLSRLSEHLQYGWCYVQPMPGPGQNSRNLGRHVFQTWKPWVVYSNGPWPSGDIDWHEDTTPPSVASKAFRWQQDGGPAGYLLDRLTAPGSLILDPLAGHGTYGCVAVGKGRHFIGVEADAGRFGKAVTALSAGRSALVGEPRSRMRDMHDER